MECDGEVSYIWWPSRDTVLYVGPMLVKEQDVVKGVWSRAEQPDKVKKVASTDGLGFEASHYSFYPSRAEEQLAYVGVKGLEYLDYEERVIYRYTNLEARTPLAWNESRERDILCRPGWHLQGRSGRRVKMAEDRKTKIVATLGPACRDVGTLERMIAAGMDVARINASHATPEAMREEIQGPA